MAAQLGQDLSKRGDDPLTVADYPAVMAEVDAALSSVYGPVRGARSPLADGIVQAARRAQRAVATEAVRSVERVLSARDPALLAVIRQETEGVEDGRQG